MRYCISGHFRDDLIFPFKSQKIGNEEILSCIIFYTKRFESQKILTQMKNFLTRKKPGYMIFFKRYTAVKIFITKYKIHNLQTISI